jgi:dipeptidyl aminopeptidase/acylaminoacyl peptidase
MQYGVLYYPFNYVQGKRYPVIFHMYEQFSNEGYEANDKILNANGYFVVRPSVPTRTDPGYEQENWLKGASGAANKLIDMGIADSSKLGVYGTSYGGLATYTMITQTTRFKAAVAISGLTDIISLYTDSPRMILRNMAFAESKTDQLNIGATLWEQPQKYIQFSAIMFADRIKTPLLIVTGEQDHNVPYTQGQEMFYALRRLGRDVEWVNYVNGGHGPWSGSESDYKDFQRRLVAWFDEHLKKEKPKM